MKWFTKIFKTPVINYILNYLSEEQVKKNWVKRVNAQIDLPGIDETTEQKLIQQVIDKSFEEFKVLIEKI